MPIAQPSTSSAEPRAVLVAALSGRALAAAARRAGARVVVLDLFADRDTRAYAAHCLKLPESAGGFDRAALRRAVARLAPEVSGLVYGSGFESEPSLLGELAAVLPLFGNAAATVAAVKDPMAFAALLGHLDLPHPETRRIPPPSGEGWLCKRVGGAGGSHVSPLSVATVPDAGGYYQRRVPGRPISALFVADGRNARILGLSEQWVAAAEQAPYRFGGCAGPVDLPPALAGAVADACVAITARTGLVGLNSLDLLVEDDSMHVLEVNPRPGATLDLFDGVGGASLWQLHLDGVAGRLPAPLTASSRQARAASVLYAPCEILIPRDMRWPGWSADRGAPGSRVDRGAPLCTVRATGETALAARLAVERRAVSLLGRLAGDRVLQL